MRRSFLGMCDAQAVQCYVQSEIVWTGQSMRKVVKSSHVQPGMLWTDSFLHKSGAAVWHLARYGVMRSFLNMSGDFTSCLASDYVKRSLSDISSALFLPLASDDVKRSVHDMNCARWGIIICLAIYGVNGSFFDVSRAVTIYTVSCLARDGVYLEIAVLADLALNTND